MNSSLGLILILGAGAAGILHTLIFVPQVLLNREPSPVARKVMIGAEVFCGLLIVVAVPIIVTSYIKDEAVDDLW